MSATRFLGLGNLSGLCDYVPPGAPETPKDDDTPEKDTVGYPCYSHQNAIVLALPSDLHLPWVPEDTHPCHPCSATLLTYIPHCRRETGAIRTPLCYCSCQGKCESSAGEEGRRGQPQSSSLLPSDQQWLSREEKERGITLMQIPRRQERSGFLGCSCERAASRTVIFLCHSFDPLTASCLCLKQVVFP